jgi:hypothetical protein
LPALKAGFFLGRREYPAVLSPILAASVPRFSSPLLAGCSLASPFQSYLPDHHRAMGAINPKVTQQDRKTIVCVSEWQENRDR